MNKKRPHIAAPPAANFDGALQERAAAFLALTVPAELQRDYVAGSLADRVIAACARNEALDPDVLELAELACLEYEELIARARTAELAIYFTKSRDLLEEIIAAAH